MFDSQIFDFQKYGGISYYFYQLYSGLREKKVKATIAAKSTFNESLKGLQEIKPLNQVDFYGLRRLQYEALKWKNKLFLNKHLKSANDVIYHSTFYFPYCKSKNVKEVITIHDMIHEDFPHYFSNAKSLISLKKQKIESCNHIICVSNYTKQRLLAIYPKTPESKVSVIHHGIDLKKQEKNSRKNVLLYIGNRNQYKGFKEMLFDIKEWFLSNPSWQLWCWGGGNFSNKEQSLFSSLGLIDQILFIPPSKKSKEQILSEAAILTLPSFIEGFGLPLIEALHLNCPVLARDIPVFKEVGGEFANFFNDKTSLINGIETISKGISKLPESKFESVKKHYSLDRMVDQTLEVYSKVIKS